MSDTPAPAPPPVPSPRPGATFASLFAAALTARDRAYAPYSGYWVGAALLTADGEVHAGANVENAAYPQGQCAEASAIGAMIAAGGGRRITEVVVVGAPAPPSPAASPADGAAPLCTPCGGCRQRLREFAGPDTLIHVCDPGGPRATFTLGALLPFSFGPDNLGF